MLENRSQDCRAVSGRWALETPLVFAGHVVLRALKEEHTDLPMTTPLDVQMRRQMI